jgi:hypothetical protein
MQMAMLGGFATSYPINWLLIRAGWKEEMWPLPGDLRSSPGRFISADHPMVVSRGGL